MHLKVFISDRKLLLVIQVGRTWSRGASVELSSACRLWIWLAVEVIEAKVPSLGLEPRRLVELTNDYAILLGRELVFGDRYGSGDEC